MAKKKRVTRKQLLKEPDEFLTLSARAIQFTANNKKPVLVVVIALVVAMVAFAGFAYFSGLSERKAFAMFEQGREEYVREISRGQPTPAEGMGGERFEAVIRKYPSTNAARFSHVFYGDVNYYRGDLDEAIELYQRALKAFSDDGAVKKLLWNDLAHAHEAKKDYEAAAGYFRKITETPDDFMKADAYWGLGRVLEALNKPKGALEAYDELVESFPDAPGYQIAREKVLRLQETALSE